MDIDKELKAIAEDIWLTQVRNYVSSAWIGHAPFLRLLIRELKPNVFVELGTHNGFSYFVGCQTVQELALPTKTYAVDHWVGDPHAGEFDASVYEGVVAINAQYKTFSTLLKMSFIDASSKFEDGTVNLLHIDGFHTYEAVKEDFETWLPKMEQNGVVIFHDIHVRHADFGVFKYWAELKKKYSTIEFVGSYGLGVVFLGKPKSPQLQILLAITEQNDAAQIHGTFGGLSDAVIQNFRNLESAKYLTQIAKLDAEKAKYLTQIAKLDAENLHSQIKLLSVMNSKSWRITKPLRVLTNLIRKANAK